MMQEMPPAQAQEKEKERRIVVAFINKSSGERSSAKYVEQRLNEKLGEERVFDLFPGKNGPAIKEAEEFLEKVKPDIVVVAGGDGTVSLAMQIIETVQQRGSIPSNSAYIAVIPMGTGNDLSRSLGFGAGYVKPATKAKSHFNKKFETILSAAQSRMDRWDLIVDVVPQQKNGEVAKKSSKKTKCASCEETSPKGEEEEDVMNVAPLSANEVSRGSGSEGEANGEGANNNNNNSGNNTASEDSNDGHAVFKQMINYFSIGFDAAVANNFGDFRDKHPGLCKSRVFNKGWYGMIGVTALFTETAFSRSEIRVVVDGQQIDLPKGMRALVVGNVLTYAGGSILWDDDHGKFKPPSINDGMLEVTALFGVWHMAGVTMKVRNGHKVAQGSVVNITCHADVSMQYDGEPMSSLGTSKQNVSVTIKKHSSPLVLINSKTTNSESNEEGENEEVESPEDPQNDE